MPLIGAAVLALTALSRAGTAPPPGAGAAESVPRPAAFAAYREFVCEAADSGSCGAGWCTMSKADHASVPWHSPHGGVRPAERDTPTWDTAAGM